MAGFSPDKISLMQLFPKTWFKSELFVWISTLVIFCLHYDLQVFDFGYGKTVDGFKGITATGVAFAHFAAPMNNYCRIRDSFSMAKPTSANGASPAAFTAPIRFVAASLLGRSEER